MGGPAHIKVVVNPPTQYSLGVSVVGQGSISKSPNQATYASGNVVTLTATPISGWTFSGWSGALSGSTNPTQITMTTDRTVTATFTQQPNLTPIMTYWKSGINSYSFSNPSTVWSNGNCYGIASTSILYYMQYDMPWCSSYPFYPLQPSPAKSTHELVMPSSTSSLNGVSLEIMFHQQYDPNAYVDPGKWSISVKNELQQFNYLLGNLTQKLPVVLGLGDSTHSDHAVVAWGAEPIGNGFYFIDIYDSSVVNTNGNFAGDDQLATFNTITNTFYYSSYDHFDVEIPTMISTAWFPTLVDGYGNYLSTIWLTNWLRFSPPALTNYYIVVADKMASVTCGSLKDYFSTSGDSRSFVCGIPGSCGIEEGNLQVYAIPTSMGLPSVDPGSTESNVLITHITNESGTLTGYGYLLNAQATHGELNYTVTPLNNGLLLNPSKNGLIANITFFSSTENDHTIFYATNIPVEGEQIGNFSFTDWKSLNSTNPTTLQISKLNQPSQITTCQPTNNRSSQTISQTQPSQQGLFNPIAAVYLIAVVAAVAIIVVAIVFLKRKSAKTHTSTVF